MSNNIDRSNLLTALYETVEISELLKKFDSHLTVFAKGTKDKKRIILMEQILFYSHAIIYNQKVQTATKWRSYFIKVAKENKALGFTSNEVNEVFSHFNNTTKAKILKASGETTVTAQKTEEKQELDNCIAKNEIRRLKDELDSKKYELSKGQKADDKEAFIKIALMALSTGSRLKDIMEDLTITTKSKKVYFEDGKSSKESVIIGLDTKTAQSYIRAIRSHYGDRIKDGTDISTGIRKAIKRLNIPKATNTNHLNALYKECVTSSQSK